MAKDTYIRINPQDMANLTSSMKKLEKLDKGGLSSEVGAWAMHTAKDASALAPKKLVNYLKVIFQKEMEIQLEFIIQNYMLHLLNLELEHLLIQASSQN